MKRSARVQFLWLILGLFIFGILGTWLVRVLSGGNP